MMIYANSVCIFITRCIKNLFFVMGRDKTKEMFYHGYNHYMQHAYPLDELNPIQCVGRGPDRHHPDNWNINDVLGGFSVTLLDTLGTLAILGNQTEFERAVNLVIDHLTFDLDSRVQVFEVTIRALGGLLSGGSFFFFVT